MERRPRNRAHRIVEEFMLAANEAVARSFGGRALPTIYRVHGLPDEEKLRGLPRARPHPRLRGARRAARAARSSTTLLHVIEGHAQQRALNQLLLRAMMQAVYATENIGHYGLAAEHYLHFTSPIRRYPDLMVHRLLKEDWAGRRTAAAGRAEGARGGEAAEARSAGRKAPAELHPPKPGRPPRELGRWPRSAPSASAPPCRPSARIAAYYAALFMKDKVGQALRRAWWPRWSSSGSSWSSCPGWWRAW